MKPILPALFCAVAVALIWQTPEEPEMVAGWKVTLATNGMPAHASWRTSSLYWTNDLPPGFWRLAFQSIDTNGQPVSPEWSVGFVIRPPKPPVVLTNAAEPMVTLSLQLPLSEMQRLLTITNQTEGNTE